MLLRSERKDTHEEPVKLKRSPARLRELLTATRLFRTAISTQALLMLPPLAELFTQLLPV